MMDEDREGRNVKSFMLFFHARDADGGAGDFVRAFETLDAAQSFFDTYIPVPPRNANYAHIAHFNPETGDLEIVSEAVLWGYDGRWTKSPKWFDPRGDTLQDER